ncbi:GtrA family protein [Streptacidiphilus monticola]|uniref:GtrA family protein n=1 Tax=Streptacidiphilus monticola TaxID=2161674 RepID=A0ABW1GA19_9ACTN
MTVGLCGLATNMLGFNLLNRPWSGLGVVSAGMLATLAGVLVTYVGNRWWTYRGRVTDGTRGVFLRFLAFSCVGLLIENGVLALGHYGLGADTRLADNAFKLLGLVLGTAFRFVSYRSWVFRGPAAGAAAHRPDRRSTAAGRAALDSPSARGADRAGRG